MKIMYAYSDKNERALCPFHVKEPCTDLCPMICPDETMTRWHCKLCSDFDIANGIVSGRVLYAGDAPMEATV